MLILASQSPQRKRLLTNMGYDFTIIPSSYKEVWNDDESIEENAIRFAKGKAEDVFRHHSSDTVIACDTFVVHPEKGVYMKPENAEEAASMLSSYSVATVRVISALAVFSPQGEDVRVVDTFITFASFPESVVEEWLAKNEWQGRSGACSIEGFASRYVQSIDGCFFNIVGLPTQVLEEMLSK